MSDIDAAEKRLDEMDRANLFLNHGRAKHADACWRCDEPWPCLTMRVILDADHEWAQWHDKWIAALDLMGSQAERAEKAEAELAEIRLELRKTDPRDLPLSNVEMIQRLQAALEQVKARLEVREVGHVEENKRLKAELTAERERAEKLEKALSFYADTRRYQGSNQRYRDGDDNFTPPGSPYLIDTHRDGGKIAREVLRPAAPVIDLRPSRGSPSEEAMTTPKRTLEEIEADIRVIETDIVRMLAEVTGGRSAPS